MPNMRRRPGLAYGYRGGPREACFKADHPLEGGGRTGTTVMSELAASSSAGHPRKDHRKSPITNGSKLLVGGRRPLGMGSQMQGPVGRAPERYPRRDRSRALADRRSERAGRRA